MHVGGILKVFGLFAALSYAVGVSAQFRLTDSGGTNAVGFQAPAAVTGPVLWTLPPADGSANQCLATNGSGSLIWRTTATGTGDFLANGSIPMTGVFQSVAGAAGTPGIAFSGDTNNGIFAPAADTIAMTTDGGERLRVTAAGNVGIGTTNPTVRLNVGTDYSGLNGSEVAQFGNNTAESFITTRARTGNGIIGYSYTSGIFGAHDDGSNRTVYLDTFHNPGSGGPLSTQISFRTAGSERMVIAASGKVGIGVTAPTTVIDVRGAASGAPATTGTVQTNGVLRLGNSVSNMALDFGNDGGNSASWIQSVNRSDLSILTGRLLLNPAGGNVGIGTTAPNIFAVAGRTALTIQGPTNGGALELATGAADADGNILGIVQTSDINTLAADKRVTAIRSKLSGTTANNRGGNMEFWTKPDAGSIAQRMTLDSAGNLGIGMIPEVTLDVFSSSSPSKVRIRGATGTNAFDKSSPGLELTVASANATAKYGAGIKFMSTDPDLTTENPKFFAGIVGYATETYGANTSGGGGLEFFTSPNAPGAASAAVSRMVIDNNGNVGIGTTSPAASLDVKGHIGNSATGSPALSACGTGPAIVGNDTRGTVTMGASAAACTLTFTSAFSTAPYCVVTASNVAGAGLGFYIASVSTTAITVDFSAAGGGAAFNYICMQ